MDTFNIDDSLKNKLEAAINDYQSKKSPAIRPVLDQLKTHIKKGTISKKDMYMARYLWDMLAGPLVNDPTFAQLKVFVENIFGYVPEPPKATTETPPAE